MYCIKCGQQLIKDAKYCYNCGTQVQANLTSDLDKADDVALYADDIIVNDDNCSTDLDETSFDVISKAKSIGAGKFEFTSQPIVQNQIAEVEVPYDLDKPQKEIDHYPKITDRTIFNEAITIKEIQYSPKESDYEIQIFDSNGLYKDKFVSLLQTPIDTLFIAQLLNRDIIFLSIDTDKMLVSQAYKERYYAVFIMDKSKSFEKLIDRTEKYGMGVALAGHDIDVDYRGYHSDIVFLIYNFKGYRKILKLDKLSYTLQEIYSTQCTISEKGIPDNVPINRRCWSIFDSDSFSYGLVQYKNGRVKEILPPICNYIYWCHFQTDPFEICWLPEFTKDHERIGLSYDNKDGYLNPDGWIYTRNIGNKKTLYILSILFSIVCIFSFLVLNPIWAIFILFFFIILIVTLLYTFKKELYIPDLLKRIDKYRAAIRCCTEDYDLIGKKIIKEERWYFKRHWYMYLEDNIYVDRHGKILKKISYKDWEECEQ